MSKVKEIGRLSLKNDHDKWNIEWTVENIFSFTVPDECFTSPGFSIRGSQWFFRIYPNGETSTSAGCIGLYLYLGQKSGESPSATKSANFSFGVKKADGTVHQIGDDIRWQFGNDGSGFGQDTFLKRSALQRWKSEWAPSDALTVTCSLWVKDKSEPASVLGTLSKNLADLFTSKRGCDATLKVKCEEFPVHKCILAARSTVFEAMFEADMKEKQTGVVDIVDCDPGAFGDFLAYLYSGNFRIDSNKVFEVYRIADKYDVRELKSVCILHMMSHVSVDNVCETAVLADEFDEEQLNYKIQYFFNDNFRKIISTAHWESLLEVNSRLANQLLKQMACDKEM